ncbi:MAG: bacillithiol biosynthesis deacetylase BshB1 [Sedimentisphaerales bacterium]|nr:bacillithiol biosynthesis deacetylase BshB1 [Sedimentisphaerales bacterium]
MDKRILIFSPHPDDAELGMGGTIAKFLDEGWEVILADLTNGEPTPAGSVEIRAAETRAANDALGLTQRICLELPNRTLENTLENRRILAEAIRRHRPRWLFTVMLPDAHPDHIAAHHLVVDSRFAAKLTKTDMAFEPHYPERIFFFYASHLRIHPEPRFLVDVSGQWDRKIAAIEAYRSQFWSEYIEPERRGWVVDYVTTACRYFGDRLGVRYAEPFFTQELVGIGRMDALC